MDPVIIVHGGAWNIPKEAHPHHLKGCGKALDIGWDLLGTGSSSVEIVEEVVRTMEDDPTFDAGQGSFLNSSGEVEMDAMIMSGTDLRFGSVAGIQCVRHPVSVARQIMEDGRHSMLVGPGALRFASERGMEIIPSKRLLMERELRRWTEIRTDETFTGRRIFEHDLPMGTVGAVALDLEGGIAAATSTGGTPNKLPGRVGDSPLIGCGTYADDGTAGISVTGHGESIMRVMLARRVSDLVEQGAGAMVAARSSIDHLEKKVDGLGGVIVIDKEGGLGYAHNTPYMCLGLRKGERRQVTIRPPM
jgi:beta-aspartyl-peptidase (threonine type)